MKERWFQNSDWERLKKRRINNQRLDGSLIWVVVYLEGSKDHHSYSSPFTSFLMKPPPLCYMYMPPLLPSVFSFLAFSLLHVSLISPNPFSSLVSDAERHTRFSLSLSVEAKKRGWPTKGTDESSLTDQLKMTRLKIKSVSD